MDEILWVAFVATVGAVTCTMQWSFKIGKIFHTSNSRCFLLYFFTSVQHWSRHMVTTMW